MEKSLLEITDVCAEVHKKPVLNGVNLRIEKGRVYALLGPNGSGKSSLAQTISGNPLYHVTGGHMCFEGKSITALPPEKRVALGLALCLQNPPAVKGVTLASLLDVIGKGKKYAGPEIVSGDLLSRDVNAGFSGGEKKLSEFEQIVALKPKLVIFDEIDSGLDVKNVALLAKLITRKLIKHKITVLFITHAGTILDAITPDVTYVLLDGRIICTSENFKDVLTTIKKYGYEKCRQCTLLAGRSQG